MESDYPVVGGQSPEPPMSTVTTPLSAVKDNPFVRVDMVRRHSLSLRDDTHGRLKAWVVVHDGSDEAKDSARELSQLLPTM